MAAVKRLQQGIRALLAFTQELDYELASDYLSPGQMQLFHRLARVEKLHSLNVLRAVLAQSPETPHDLAVAALLHDIGKTRWRLGVLEKSFSVLLRRLAPSLEYRLSAEDRLNRWRAPFVVRRHHPAWGAEILSEVGASERLIWLVAHHADDPMRWDRHPDVALLRRLQAADDAN